MTPTAAGLLQQEARALLARLTRVRPFSLVAPMPVAAMPPGGALAEVERSLVAGRSRMREWVHGFLRWLESRRGQTASDAEGQSRFARLRLRFNAVLSECDLLGEAVTQRSEHETGVLLAGLDAAAADALALPDYYQPPPLMCYLDRGVGAAIRRAGTRLPSGAASPVAVIRIPRERMVGSGLAASLFHEVGHQAAALLNLVDTLKASLRAHRPPGHAFAWHLFEQWIGEILSDFWACARLGVGATLGLIGTLSLPRSLVFAFHPAEVHPVPWLRVRLSCAIGRRLFADPQWTAVERLWTSFYPATGLDAGLLRLFQRVLDAMPAFVSVLAAHRSAALRGRTLVQALDVDSRRPGRLQALLESWRQTPERLYCAAPSLAFAVISQARARGQLTPEEESHLLTRLLTHWALRGAAGASAALPIPRPIAA